MSRDAEYWQKRAEQRLTEMEKYSEDYIRRVKKMYEKAERDIKREIANVYKNYASQTGLSVDELKKLLSKSETQKTWLQLKRQGLDKYILNNYKARITRLEQIKAQIYARIKEIAEQEKAITSNMYGNIVKDSYYKSIYDTEMGTGIKMSFSKIDDNLVKSVLEDRWSGKNFSQRIWGNTDILGESIGEIVGGGLISGISIEKMTRQLSKKFDTGKYYAERLARSEANHFYNLANFMAYEDMGVEEYVFVAVLDNRTSQICQELDGQKFKVKDRKEGVNAPRMHPNCRSTTHPYVDEISESLLNERWARDPVTDKEELVGNITYKEWYKQKVEEHGQEKMDKAYKMVKNRSSDIKQYLKYKEVIGDEIGTLDYFKNVKYNDADTWKNIKEYAKLKTKNEIPKELTLSKFDSNIKGVNWEAVNFSPNRVNQHIQKHMNEFGYTTGDEYIKNAIQFLNRNDNEIETFEAEYGVIYKYDAKNNVFGTVHENGIIKTYYKPKHGLKYWEDKKEKYEKK